VAVFFPLGIAAAATPAALAIGFGAFFGKTLLLATYLAVVESSYAKLRFFRLPQFLGMGFLCAFLALALRTLR
jgi:formate hydrogenlyase subunit 4